MLKKPILSTLAQSGGKIVMVLISLATTAILTRKLGAEIYGSFTLLTATFILLDALADFGSRVIGVREAAKKKDIYSTSLVKINEFPISFWNWISLNFLLASFSFN